MKQAIVIAQDKQALELVADQTEYDMDVRVAAHIFLLLSGSREKLKALEGILREFYSTGFEEWFMTPLLSYLEELSHDNETRQFVGELLGIARGNLSDRAFLQHRLLHAWREKSDAPIQKSALLEKWLSN